MSRIGIVICNYNKKDMVTDCIKAVFEQTYQDFDLYVCDNGFTDGSGDAIEAEYGSRLTLIRNSENLGGSGGFNTGLRAACKRGYDYYMCIDNDAFLDEGCVSNLLDFLEEHGDVGIAAAKIYHMERPDTVQNFGQIIDFKNYCTEVPYLGYTEDGSMPDFVYTEAVPACALMIRKEVISDIGLLPEENFLYWDDTEWCFRAREAGWKIASVGSAKALHCMGARREDVSTFPTYYAWRNWIRFFILHTPEEDLPNMGITFLTSVYLVQCEGYEGDRFARAATVMAAYEDAIDGVCGKAAEGIIRDIEKDGREVRFDSIADLPAEYEKGRELFIFANLPGFLRKAQELRKNNRSRQ